MKPGVGTVFESGEEDLRGPLRKVLNNRYVHYRRAAEILAALSRYGFGRAWDSTRALRGLPAAAEATGETLALSPPVRFKLLLEGLGPTFVKLGQMLSTRADLIPEEYAAELSHLRDDVAPVPFEKVRAIVQGELRAKIEDLFTSFEERPIAAASIGQVHRAVARSGGATVAVKVQRPDILEDVKADIEILRDLGRVLQKSFSAVERFDPEGVVEEFSRMMQRELDYTLEALNIRRFSENFKEVKDVAFPQVHWELSTRRVLTMDFIAGVPLDRKEELDRLQVDRKAIIGIVGQAFIKMMFVDGFFHADPHQGNIFLMGDGRVCFLDLGAIGYLDDQSRDRISLFYLSMAHKEVGRAARVLMELSGATPAAVDMPALEWDLRDFLDFVALRRGGIVVGRGANQRVISIAVKHGIVLPSSFVLLERALGEVEGVCRDLDPAFDMVDRTEKSLAMLMESRYDPKQDPVRAMETARGYQELVELLPGHLDRLLKKLEGESLAVKVEGPALGELLVRIRRTGKILAATILASALLLDIGLAGGALHLRYLDVTLGVSAVLAIWLAAVVRISRRG